MGSTEKAPETLYRERLQRVLDAVALKVPDRVPIVSPFQAFPYYYAGVSLREAMNDYARAREACHRFVDDFQPDLDFGPVLAFPAPAMEILGLRWFRWPGHGLDDNTIYQFVEGEYMRGDEYDEFLYDPSHFMASRWLPRSFAGLEGLAELPPMRRMMWFAWSGLFPPLAAPGLRGALETLLKGAEELQRWWDSIAQYTGEIRRKGFPLAYAGWSYAPFDLVGDTLRGTTGIFTDMFRRPDKLLEAVDKATRIAIESGAGAAGSETPFCWIWLHKGSEGFMSPKQFDTFYWPSLRRLIVALVEKGVIPVVYCEGEETARLERFADVPRGKVIYHFAGMDMARAKEVLGGVACISGNLPNRLLQTGTPDDVRQACKALIDTCGKGGGYILDTSALVDEARPENVKAMFEFTREYGVYR